MEHMREHFIDETRSNLCKKFFIEFGGRNHLLIQQAMRDAGYKTFNSRCLYRNSGRPGYIERFGWRDLPEVPKRPISKRKQRRMISTGPVDPASFQAWLKKISPGYTWDWRYQQLGLPKAGGCHKRKLETPDDLHAAASRQIGACDGAIFRLAASTKTHRSTLFLQAITRS